ncbi:efflux RND transporter periplasmic adaptor subunit [Patescibacteria group bacterium]|nr:efflux RND transporter periplasmic adaptor subunit [Patescibacteria group bacterium]
MKAGIQKIITLIKKHKVPVSVGIAIFIIALAVLPQRIQKIIAGPQAQYETTKVKKEDIIQAVSASGEVESQEQVTLQFQTSGKLAWVGVKAGDQVNKWQAIASLDKRELEQDLKKELNDYMNERWDFEQEHEDYETSGKTKEQWLVTDAIKRILEKAQFDLNNAVIDVEIVDLAIKLATIVTPIDGIVTDIDSPVAGVNITPATARFTIANPGNMKFVANVDESDIGKVTIGQRVLVSLDAYPDEIFEGEVTNIAFAAITTRGGGTAFPVDIILPENIDQRFKVGMNGDTELIIAEKSEVLTVTPEAISTKKGETYLQVIEGRAVKDIKVEKGLESDTQVEIISGVSEGQLVITGEKER